MRAYNFLRLLLLRLNNRARWAQPEKGLRFIFPVAGTGAYVSGFSSQPLRPGDMLIASGEGAGQICATYGNEFVFQTFSLRIEHLFPLFSGREISLVQPLAQQFKKLRFFPATSRLAAKCHLLLGEVSLGADLEHRSQLLRIVAAILNEEFQSLQQNPAVPGHVEQLLEKVFQTLSVQQLVELSVDELALKFSCSRRQLNRVFHRYFNVSVATLKMEMRLLKATTLLRDPEAKVINVAADCGFNHLGLFNVCFRKRFGTSPSEWRRAAGLSTRPRQSATDWDFRHLSLSQARESWSQNIQGAVQAGPTHSKARRPGDVIQGTPNPDSQKLRARSGPALVTVVKEGPNQLTFKLHSPP